MNLFSYRRLAELFDTIINETLPQQELAHRFAVSTRTIRTDVLALNAILSNYGAKIDYKRDQGYQLRVIDSARYAQLPMPDNQARAIPRTGKDRVLALLLQLLTQTEAIKLDDLAEAWYISRSALQVHMGEVKAWLDKYQLVIEKKPYYGMRLIADETAIRACLTNLLLYYYSPDQLDMTEQLHQMLLRDLDLNYLQKILHNQFERFDIKLTPEGETYLLYCCAIAIVRITQGKELIEYAAPDVSLDVSAASAEISEGLTYFLGAPLSAAESDYLSVQIAARYVNTGTHVNQQIQQDSYALIRLILVYINDNYKYDLRWDNKLQQDLAIHISSILSRVKYQIHTTNPLLDEIKQYYPFAYDITLSAITHGARYVDYPLNEDEIGYLSVHIGVALERNYSANFERHPQVLLVSESSTATLRMIEAKLKRDFPQLNISQILSVREYEQLVSVVEDFVVTTVRLSNKDKPIVKIAPFPTPYQLEQLGRLAMVNRTTPYMLERFFSERFFMIIDEPISQDALFKQVCQQLEQEGYVTTEFYPSLVERESIVSTMLGENIAIPHSVGLLATKTMVVTILAPQGIVWDSDKHEVANVIFLLAISKDEYEEAMGIYNLFVNLVKEKATKRLLNSQSFADFQIIVTDSFGRII